MKKHFYNVCWVIALILLIFLLASSNKVSKATEYQTYIVKPGDTIWEISSDITPKGRDIRNTVDEIREKNKIDGFVYEGQRIEIPVYKEK